MCNLVRVLVPGIVLVSSYGCLPAEDEQATGTRQMNPDSAARDAGSAWGINAHLPREDTLDAIVAGGFDWIRISINWYVIETARDAYDWEAVDECVNAAAERGLHMVGTIAYTPAWAADTGNFNIAPASVDDWTDFVGDVVTRYHDRIRHWSLWNEPNGGGGEYWSGTPAQFREQILKPGARAARHADPSCFILAPGVTIHTDWMDWYRGILSDGGADYVDILTVHLYVTGDADDLLFHVDDRQAGLGDTWPLETLLESMNLTDRPVWLLETGWQSAGTTGVGEAEQARRLVNLLWGIHQRDVIDKVFIYDIIDDLSATPASTYGLLQHDHAPKQAYIDLAEFIENPAPAPAP